MRTEHTFLYEPAVWTATGAFWSEDGRESAIEGRTEVRHDEECWMIAGSMKVLCSPHVEFKHLYLIQPPGKDALTAKWTSENPALGHLHGTFCIVGPSILSVYYSDHGGYHGVEHLARIDADHYEACGVLLMNDRRISSWRAHLTREARAASG
ncbi:MAG: hypothetical protein DIU56_009605 [Pseudomonadota bacterium]|jgi:hypothetical protein|nr:MAG: hypothetical protein DIU56_13230 [Pseudomonadota bacterium]